MEYMMRSQPFISCIMPTANRRVLVTRAVDYFKAQDYTNRELIIVDDGIESINDLADTIALNDDRIRYLRLENKMTLGAKRNLACQEAKGEIIAHWDDDDWMARWRLSYQIESLVKSDSDVCGLERLLFYDPRSDSGWQYVYPKGRKFWVAGGTLCYKKSFWRENPFPPINIGEDTQFIWQSRSKKMIALEDLSFYVAMIHTTNTSPKRTRDARYHPYPTDEIRRLLGDDWQFYTELFRNGEAAKTSSDFVISVTEENRIDRRPMMKLNIGCCDALMEGFINVDIAPAPGVEVADLREPWPWADNSVEFIRAYDIIEHLPDKIFTMNELWRVLSPGGRVEIAVPTTDGTGAWQDPTHVSFWNRRSFLYYEAGNPYRERFAGFYGIKAKFRIAGERTDQTLDGPRLTITLEAVKP